MINCIVLGLFGGDWRGSNACMAQFTMMVAITGVNSSFRSQARMVACCQSFGLAKGIGLHMHWSSTLTL